MPEYTRFQRYHELIESLNEAVHYGRVTGKLEGYRLVLQHVQAATSLTPVKTVAPGVIQALERIIQTLETDLAKLGTPAPVEPAVQATARTPDGHERSWVTTEAGEHVMPAES